MSNIIPVDQIEAYVLETLGEYPYDYDIEGIIEEAFEPCLTEEGWKQVVSDDEYWEIVEAHDVGATLHADGKNWILYDGSGEEVSEGEIETEIDPTNKKQVSDKVCEDVKNELGLTSIEIVEQEPVVEAEEGVIAYCLVVAK